jgi:GGDEF domain-containing protein
MATEYRSRACYTHPRQPGAAIGAAESFTAANRLEVIQRMEELQRMAFLDTLTGPGTGVRRDSLKSRIEELRRHGCRSAWRSQTWTASQVNDRRTPAGDDLIALVARTLVANVVVDLVSRWGGDEFLVVPPTSMRIASSRWLRSCARRGQCSLPDTIEL